MNRSCTFTLIARLTSVPAIIRDFYAMARRRCHSSRGSLPVHRSRRDLGLGADVCKTRGRWRADSMSAEFQRLFQTFRSCLPCRRMSNDWQQRDLRLRASSRKPNKQMRLRKFWQESKLDTAKELLRIMSSEQVIWIKVVMFVALAERQQG